MSTDRRFGMVFGFLIIGTEFGATAGLTAGVHSSL